MSDSSREAAREFGVPPETLAKLSMLVIGTEPLPETLYRVAALAKDTIPGVLEASITLVENEAATSVGVTGPLAARLDERQYAAGFGPCMDAAVSGHTIVVDHRERARSPYPDFSVIAGDAGVTHSVSVGLPVAQRVIGALNVYGSAEPFSAGAVALAEGFAGYAAVAIANAALYSQSADLALGLQTAMLSRAIIEQAKGILMVRTGCSSDEAFLLLIRRSQDQNLKLRSIAHDIVASTQG